MANLEWTNGKLNKYDGISLTTLGIPVLVARIDTGQQSASIAATTIYTPATAGEYFALIYHTVSALGNAVTETPTILWNDGAAQSVAASSPITLNVGGNYGNGGVMMRCNAGTNIQYSTTVSGAAGTGRYILWIILFRLS